MARAGRGAPTVKSLLERHFYTICKYEGLPLPETEVPFHPTRKWRFDFGWVGAKVAVEIEGGIWTQGRHNRGAAMEKDMEKYNEAALLGWLLLRFSNHHVEDGSCMAVVRRALEVRGAA